MNPEELENKLQKMNESLQYKSIVYDFPSILEDIEYMLKTHEENLSSLTDEQRIDHLYDIEYQKIDYLAELIKRYMQITWKKEFSYEIVEGYLFNSTAGYNQKDDIVTVSVFGILNNSFNLADTIKSITHEYRHQLQYHFLHEKEFKDIIDYPPYFITIAKNMLPKEIITEVDEEGYVVAKPYYHDNYKRLYMEIDANMYGLEVSRKILKDLYELYPYKSEELEDKVNELQNILIEQSNVVEDNLKYEKRVSQPYLDEIYTTKPITSRVLVEDIEKDSLLFTDTCIKEHPEIKEKYEVLNILMHDYGFMNYWNIILEKYRQIEKFGNKDKIEEIYKYIIKSDPYLLITKYLTEKDKNKLKKFLNAHPTFIDDYKEDIKEIINLLVLDSDTLNLISKEENVILKKERN